ncbi:unnamed protein product [Parajaminaea phylloscopi]
MSEGATSAVTKDRLILTFIFIPGSLRAGEGRAGFPTATGSADGYLTRRTGAQVAALLACVAAFKHFTASSVAGLYRILTRGPVGATLSATGAR